MKFTVLPARDLGPSQLARWSEIQASTPALDSPYFTPEFTRIAAEVRDGVEVAVIEDGPRVVGFFPFERGPGGVGHPVGRAFSDFHGVIAGEGTAWDGPSLLRGARLAAWRFDHLLASQAPLQAWHWSVAPSPFVDLSGGFEGYRAERKRAGSKEIEKILYEARKAERRMGAIRFVLHTQDDAVFQAVLAWKGAQLRASGMPDRLAVPWVTRLLDRIRAAQGPGFAGILSALYIGDELAAAHLGMRSAGVIHYWLPAYDPKFSAVSPGHLCFLELAKLASAQGIRRVDLGKGPEAYKARIMTGSTPVAEGAIHLRAHVGAMWRTRYRAVAWARRSALRNVLRGPGRWLRRVMVSDS